MTELLDAASAVGLKLKREQESIFQLGSGRDVRCLPSTANLCFSARDKINEVHGLIGIPLIPIRYRAATRPLFLQGSRAPD